MALAYTVQKAFAHEGTYYTRQNADDVKKLPRKVRDELIERGLIEEHDRQAPDTEPPAAA